MNFLGIGSIQGTSHKLMQLAKQQKGALVSQVANMREKLILKEIANLKIGKR